MCGLKKYAVFQVENVKRFTFVSYVLLLFIAAGLIAVGIYFRLHNTVLLKIVPESHPSIRNAYWVTVAFGAMLIPVVIVGFCSLYSFNVVLLTWQVGLIFFMVVMNSSIGFYAIIRSLILTLNDKSMIETLEGKFMLYFEDNESKNFVDYIQKTYSCCGASGVFWWYRIKLNFMPESCHRDNEYQNVLIDYKYACNIALMKCLKASTAQMGYWILGLTLAQWLLMFFPVYLVYDLRMGKAADWDENESETDMDFETTETETDS